MAKDGHAAACYLLAAAKCDSSIIVEHARSRLDIILKQHTYSSDGLSRRYGLDFTRDAILMKVLDLIEREAFVEAMLRITTDQKETKINCIDALHAIVIIAECVSEDLRKRIFDVAVECAQGDHDGGSGVMESTQDPLSFVQVDYGSQSLRGPGISCAVISARGDDEYRAIRRLAFQLLLTSDSSTSNAAACALGFLPGSILVEEIASEDIQALADNSNEDARAIAALCWAETPDIAPDMGLELASDSAFIVRGALANALGDLPAHKAVAGVLVEDPRRSIRVMAQKIQ